MQWQTMLLRHSVPCDPQLAFWILENRFKNIAFFNTALNKALPGFSQAKVYNPDLLWPQYCLKHNTECSPEAIQKQKGEWNCFQPPENYFTTGIMEWKRFEYSCGFIQVSCQKMATFEEEKLFEIKFEHNLSTLLAKASVGKFLTQHTVYILNIIKKNIVEPPPEEKLAILFI